MSNSESLIYFTEQGLLSKPLNKKGLKNNKEKIRIDFSIANSSNGSYSVQAKLYDRQVLDYFSETKQSFIKQDINFEKFFVCDFIFEKQQDIVITLKKNDEEIKINTTLGGIVGSRDSKVIYKYAGDESFIIKAKKLGNYEDLLDVKFILRENNQLGESNFFVKNKFFYFITCNNKKVYKSSFISKDGTFENIYIPTCLLQPYYSVYFYNSFNQPIFHFNNSIKNIKSNQKIQFKIPVNNKAFYLEDKSVIIKNFSLTDYINSGIKIALSIGIDFTSSNGNPLDYGTNHSIRGNTLNDYEKAIYSCGKIVGKYDYDQKFPVYSFGAIINLLNDNIPRMCFNLNFSDNPDITSIDNVLKYYRDCLKKKKLTFSGPNNFAPLIKKVLSRINKNDIFEYHILMILTNGIISDLQPTIDALVEASSYPLSVIIIGIGKRDFKKMEILDGDEIPLISSTGQKWKRDLVQFVPFTRYESDEKKLAMEVLAEIPRQIVEFYRCNNLNPIQIKEQNIKRSFNSQFVSNNDYFFNNKNFKITRSMSNKVSSRKSNQTGINFNQNIQTTRNTYNNPINQISIKSNANSINDNNKLKNKPLSSTKIALQPLNQNNPNQNNQYEFSNNYTNNMLANANTFNNPNQGYSDRGGIYTQANNININFNNNQNVPHNSQSQRNLSNMPNPLNTNLMNNNQNIGHSYNNNRNNFSNNIINIFNNGNNNNNPQYSNITTYMNNLPLHETKKVSKK